MILNAYSVLDGFISLLRLPLGLGVVLLASLAWYRSGPAMSVEQRERWENRIYLLIVVSTVLLSLNVLAWPLLYGVLQSYVPQWPGVMCIYGVTRIGTDSIGVSRFLPSILLLLQVTKPLVVFLGGCWFVLYCLNRATASSPIIRRVLAIMVVFGMVSVADATLETSYLAIPKKEQHLDVGCCVASPVSADAVATRSAAIRFAGVDSRWITWTFVVVTALLMVPLSIMLYQLEHRIPAGWFVWLVPCAGIGMAVKLWFLGEVAAPAILRLPYHHCAYDLLPRAPESLLSVALYFTGSFAVGWAFLASWLGRHPENSAIHKTSIARLVFLALVSYLAAIVLILSEVLVAP